MKSILTSALLIICVGVFGQKVVSRSVPLNTCDSPRIFKTDTLWSYADLATSGYNFTITPQKDTVDVIALVSDTTATFSIWADGILSEGGVSYSARQLSGISVLRCKAVRDRYAMIYYGNPNQITEYLLPKKYIVWQSIIINKTK